MQSLAVGTYTADAVLYALRGVQGRRSWRFRYELLTSANVLIRQLTNVVSGSIAHDYTAEIKRSGRVTVNEDGQINYASNRIKMYAGIRMPDGGYAEWAQGVFLLTTPTKQTDITGVVQRDIECYDQTMVLVEDTVTSRYYVSSGYNVVTAVTELLGATTGINSYSIPANAGVTPAAMEWEPGTSKYQIISDLLALINYRSLWFDGNGVARSMLDPLPSAAASEFTYATDTTSVILADGQQTIDYFKVPNRWVLFVSNPDQSVLRSEIINSSATSPTSTVSRGRTITKVVTNAEAATQAVLDLKAQQQMEEDSNIFEVISFKTGLMPFHDNGDTYTIVHNDLTVNGKYKESKWSFDLVQGAEMQHEAQKTLGS